MSLFSRIFLLNLCVLSTAWAAPPVLHIALGETKMPYVSSENQSGIEYDIVTQALKLAGYQVNVEYLPNKRAQLEFRDGQLDVAISNTGNTLSEPYIAYQNMAITLCQKQINIDSIKALARYQVTAFHNANQYLGADFARIAANKSNYREVSPQQLMNRMLLADRVHVAIGDINIFKYEHKKIDPLGKQALCSFAVFPPTLYRLEFREPKVRDRFNVALKYLREQGIYEQLARKYGMPLDQNRPYFKP
jgi:polar amino acid transport system substrate-binding protein